MKLENNEKRNYEYICIIDDRELWEYLFGGFFFRGIGGVVVLPMKSAIPDIRDMRVPYISNNEEICFLVGGRTYVFYGNYLIYKLRSLYPGCKIVCIPTDLVHKHCFEPECLEGIFDASFSFEMNDAGNYDVKYIKPTYEDDNEYTIEVENDFYYIGGYNSQKGRMDDVLSLYEKLREKGYKCDFVLAGDIPFWCHIPEGIHVGSISFGENIQRILKARCIIEILQEGAQSPTVRYSQSVIYNKHLLTNCKEIMKQDAFSEFLANVHIISDTTDYECIKEPVYYEKTKVKAFFSNDAFLDKVDFELSKNERRGDFIIL